ncbi:tRNA pseudouridine(38-40) synthase TruA [Belliella kenyensis]|uniref:tRNA pseudouridine synthase A n=1 Tax=Belliella kenyensis TaxID=1472724 RepID=A0ABV8EFX2_9BACT|nr:tRNA pseudouridine(38-40) synthase TruA [Belliella kenyensis]MCH7401037.1 tRNA pseudouridine(38-40) synthase TruA [Belliella kenyensis]MDN3604035.1 tRNA pseudouridine(38-40) synthase TruA [Belliella kenyensis]
MQKLGCNSIFAAVTEISKRYFLEIAYNGAAYHGWQSQKNATSVQQTIETALSTLLRVPVAIMGSGRTDTGVHASQQFAHVVIESEIHLPDFLKKLNALLPKDIAVYSILPVRDEAHARFDAVWRSYVYKIATRKDPFGNGLNWCYYRPLDILAMNQASRLLLSHEDFECFSKVKTDVNHFGCKIKTAFWEQIGNEIHFHITANRFLRGMVRAIVGTLVLVGEGRLTLEQFQEVLDSKDRSNAGSSAPASGLFLCSVVYPEDIFV